MTSRPALVIGSTGRIGRHVVAQALAAGIVWGLSFVTPKGEEVLCRRRDRGR
ncbi:MAG TPA: hypothetical protein VIL51_11090 [Thermoleophilia bacterium]|jgi:uncharacterized protein YbjT (DUF2867 family)